MRVAQYLWAFHFHLIISLFLFNPFTVVNLWFLILIISILLISKFIVLSYIKVILVLSFIVLLDFYLFSFIKIHFTRRVYLKIIWTYILFILINIMPVTIFIIVVVVKLVLIIYDRRHLHLLIVSVSLVFLFDHRSFNILLCCSITFSIVWTIILVLLIWCYIIYWIKLFIS
jgi:hypothetical protein